MNDRLRLVLLSFLMLFVELALIRWAGSDVLYLSYFSNFVLLGSFLGNRDRVPPRAPGRANLFRYAPLALARVGGVRAFLPRQDPYHRRRSAVLRHRRTHRSAARRRADGHLRGRHGHDGVLRRGRRTRLQPRNLLRSMRIASISSAVSPVIAAFTVLSFLGTRPIVWGLVVAVVLVALDPPHVEGSVASRRSRRAGPRFSAPNPSRHLVPRGRRTTRSR